MFSRANGVRVFCPTIYEYSFLSIIYGTSFPYINMAAKAVKTTDDDLAERIRIHLEAKHDQLTPQERIAYNIVMASANNPFNIKPAPRSGAACKDVAGDSGYACKDVEGDSGHAWRRRLQRSSSGRRSRRRQCRFGHVDESAAPAGHLQPGGALSRLVRPVA